MKYRIILLILITLMLLFWFNLSKINIAFIRMFKMNTLVSRYNNQGQTEGEAILYKDGLIDKKANFIRGKKTGWAYTYYKNGRVRNKTFYRNDIEYGPDSQFYENGKLNYSGYLRSGQRYGPIRWYSKNGKLDSYAVFNIKGKSFCLFQYDLSGNIVKITGLVASPIIYSLNETNSPVILEYGEKYAGVRDLFITVAIPPNTKQSVSININNDMFSSSIIKENTIKIPNIFKKKGLYSISIKYSLTDKFDKKISGISFKEKLVIE